MEKILKKFFAPYDSYYCFMKARCAGPVCYM